MKQINKKEIFIGITILLIVLILIILLQKKPAPAVNNSPIINTQPTGISTTSPAITNNSSFSYPYFFTKINNSNSGDTSSVFTFTEDGKKYRFVASPPGQINPEIGHKADVETQNKTLGKISFKILIYKDNNLPFFIVALPEDSNIKQIFSMELPPDNPGKYILIFENILKTYSP